VLDTLALLIETRVTLGNSSDTHLNANDRLVRGVRALLSSGLESPSYRVMRGYSVPDGGVPTL
jgi:hypothetical protein